MIRAGSFYTRLIGTRLMFVLAAALILPSPARAEPALWVVKGPAATVYLFGTMHVLPRKAMWLTQKIRAAFDRSDTLWEEADVGAGDPKLVQHLLTVGMAPRTNLFAALPADYAANFRAQVARCGLSAETVAQFRPWFAAMVVPLQCALKQSDATQSGQAGPETVFLQLAHRASKATQFFETADQQIEFLSSGSSESQLRQLERSIDEAASGERAVLGAMEAAWLSGDEAALQQQMSKMQRDDQQAYQTLIIGRNRNFAAKIEELLNGVGVCFVAVGAGHLVGTDSVPDELKKRGFAPRRI